VNLGGLTVNEVSIFMAVVNVTEELLLRQGTVFIQMRIDTPLMLTAICTDGRTVAAMQGKSSVS